MSDQDDDGRLHGQENYLMGVTLRWSRYKQPSKEWDHDHCSFCYKRFAEADSGYNDAQEFGYTTNDDYHWVCKSFFDDFRQRFKWKLVKETNGDDGTTI
jgi:hypothetical protein